MTGTLSRQWFAGLHVTFERRDDAINGIVASLVFGLAFR
jgi:hypothetical protein